MIDNETYKKELVHMWDSVRDDKHKGKAMCEGVICKDCRLYDTDCEKQINAFRMIEIIEKWSREHPRKYKISRIEYEILYSVIYSIIYANLTFGDDIITCHLLKKGYFKGANEEMKIVDYFNNCEVESENCEVEAND